MWCYFQVDSKMNLLCICIYMLFLRLFSHCRALQSFEQSSLCLFMINDKGEKSKAVIFSVLNSMYHIFLQLENF